ncbi:hypothetical protein EC968_009950 [Mortierella alpina]|nr:hypothetical protein EC968_009950 [Mortierella alpina]
MAAPATSMPCTSAAVWKSFIQRPSIVLLQNLIYQFQALHQHETARLIPKMNVFKECIHAELRDKAATFLGIEFEGETNPHSKTRLSPFITMTVLQLSVLSQYAGLPADAGEREAAVEMLLEVFTPEDLNGNPFADGNNVMHLAAFLQLRLTLDLLVAHGGDPWLKNGRGLTAYDILLAVTDDHFASAIYLQKDSGSLRTVQATGDTPLSYTPIAHEIREAAIAEELDITETSLHPGTGAIPLYRKSSVRVRQKDAAVEGRPIQLDMNDSPQVFQLTFDQDRGAGVSTLTATRPRCYIPRRFDAALEGFDEVEEESDDSIRLVEQDALDLDQRRQSFYHHQHYHYNHNSSDESDADSDIVPDQDQTCYYKIRPDGHDTRAPIPLYSILKQTAGWPPQDMSPEQKQAYQAYQAYVSTLHLQSRRNTECRSDPSPDSRRNKKRVRWQPVKKVRIFRRHLYQPSDGDSQEDEPAVSEQFEEPVEDHPLAPFDSPYDSVRPMTPSAQCWPPTQMGADDHNDVSAIGHPSPPSNYTRPLPEIPQPTEPIGSPHDSPRKSISRTLTPPPLALVQDFSEKPAKSRGIPGLWSPRKAASSPYAMSRFSMSESRLGSLAKAISKREESQDDELVCGNKTISPTRPRSALAILESPPWFCKAFAETLSPLGSLSRATGRDFVKSRPSIPISCGDLKSTEDHHVEHAPVSDEQQDGLGGSWSARSKRSSLALSALLSPVYDATSKLAGRNKETAFAGNPSELHSLANLRSSIRQRFSTLPSRSLTPLQLAFPKTASRSAPSSPVSADSTASSRSRSPLEASGYLKEIIRGRTPLPARSQQPFLTGNGVPMALTDQQETIPQRRDTTQSSSSASRNAVLCRKSSSSTSRHAYWKKRKEVMVVIPPRATITSGTISMDGILLGSNNSCPARSNDGTDIAAMPSSVLEEEEAPSADCLAPVRQTAEPVYRDASDTSVFCSDLEDHDCKVDTRQLEVAESSSGTDHSYSIWKDASEVLAQTRRTTLSSCESPSTTQTGVLYLRLQRACGFSLPIPAERTMISIRIDTGHEKVDTDYVPLDRVDILFNQEFCLPVTPSLAITITLHLMQAPHLLPRSLAPPRLPSSPLPELPLIQPAGALFPCKDLLVMDDTPPVILNGSISSRASLFSSSIRTKKSFLLPLLFQKRSLQSHSDCSVSSTTVSVPSSDSASMMTDTANGSEVEAQPSLSCSTIGRAAGQQCLRSRPEQTSEFSQSGRLPLHSETKELLKARSTFSKWKSGILSVHKRRKNPTTTAPTTAKEEQWQSSKGIVAEEVEAIQPFQMQYRQEDPLQQASSDAGMLQASVLNEYLPPPPAWITSPSSSSSSSSSSPLSSSSTIPILPQLSLAEIEASETPLQVLSRHILFDDELCLARSGIMFCDLRRSCENQIVGVEFQTINNWVDLNDYSQVNNHYHSSKYNNYNNSTIYGDHGMTQGATGQRASLHTGTHHEGEGDDIDDDEEEEEEEDDAIDNRCVVAKIMTSMCFVPGPEMDPEDAIYEDESRLLPMEPQNLVECQQGLYYFQWRDSLQVRFQGQLFYLTARGHWKEAWFCIMGSKLWQCQGSISTTTTTTTITTATTEKGRPPLERVRCLELEDLQQIETNQGIVKMAVADQEDHHHHHHPHHHHPLHQIAGPREGLEDEVEPFYAPRNGFRLRLRVGMVEEEGAAGVNRMALQTVTQDFYAESPEMAQAWISSIMGACHDIPPRPYWLR